jgi:hypothetical protein
MSALAIANAVDFARREKREARYMDIVSRYDRDELERFARMLACLVEALDGEFHDAMGKLFMALELGNHWHGQFFTPYELALLMAQMQLHDAAELIKARGYVTVSEPAAGAGGMVIAVAQAVRDAGLNYQKVIHVTAQDLDSTAAHMCYVQMSLLHIPGVVIAGDTLRMTESDRWYTPAHFMGLWEWRLRRGDAISDGTGPARYGSAGVDCASDRGDDRAKANHPLPAVGPIDRQFFNVANGQLDLFGSVAGMEDR